MLEPATSSMSIFHPSTIARWFINGSCSVYKSAGQAYLPTGAMSPLSSLSSGALRLHAHMAVVFQHTPHCCSFATCGRRSSRYTAAASNCIGQTLRRARRAAMRSGYPSYRTSCQDRGRSARRPMTSDLISASVRPISTSGHRTLPS